MVRVTGGVVQVTDDVVRVTADGYPPPTRRRGVPYLAACVIRPRGLCWADGGGGSSGSETHRQTDRVSYRRRYSDRSDSAASHGHNPATAADLRVTSTSELCCCLRLWQHTATVLFYPEAIKPCSEVKRWPTTSDKINTLILPFFRGVRCVHRGGGRHQ